MGMKFMLAAVIGFLFGFTPTLGETNTYFSMIKDILACISFIIAILIGLKTLFNKKG